MVSSKIFNALFYLFFLLNIAQSQEIKQETDHFAEIGNKVQATRLHLLEEKTPAPLPEKYLPVSHNPQAVFEPVHSMNGKEELAAELKRTRKEYEVYLKDFAPKNKDQRLRINLDTFNWREESTADIQNFPGTLKGEGNWQTVKIPHYGPPLGRAVTYYFKKFDVNENMFNKGALFVRFNGVDYKAHVFINGVFLGSHEGFFAPFEFNFTRYARRGENTLLIKVENDFTTTEAAGDKIYGATGPGYDDPKLGWHHCPAGMGIYQDCYIEARDPLHINDIFVRPIIDEEKAEVWLEVNNFYEDRKDIKVQLSVYGQNFKETVFENMEYIPVTVHIPGVGDLAKPTDWEKKKLKMGYGVNFLKIPIEIKNPKLWDLKTPWLYKIQIKLYNEKNDLTDARSCQFGMRSFIMDTVSVPKGRMFLNGNQIRLRGANTMGVYQQDVMRKDWDQLIDDILLAKICNMNFMRTTQRPVQKEFYEYCDKLGLMTQTDLPLFGTLRPNQWAEAVRQAEEMERLVRGHPANIMVTYINERFPNAEGGPQRSIGSAEDYYRFFTACDQAVHMANPDRVIKAGDGDYDPPSPGLPDNHCYNAWYNGHGLGLGKLHKGYWQWVKPNWLYACGEFGAEGLDPLNVMQKYYPKEWLPKNKEDEKKWTANRIAKAQTQKFHYMWFNTQHSLADWIEASQNHQAWATKLYTESFRRDSNMVSFAIHLFIDNWPAGWMKTIMDVDRNPKKAFFVYRDALKPLMVSLRTDRYHFFSGEDMNIEAWICNDLNEVPKGYVLKYQFEKEGKILTANTATAVIPVNSVKFQGFLKIPAPQVNQRTSYTFRAALFNEKNAGVSESVINLDVFPEYNASAGKIYCSPSSKALAKNIVNELEMDFAPDLNIARTILIDDFNWYQKNREKVDRLVKEGKTIVFLELPKGSYKIAGTTVEVMNTSMGSYYFASPTSGHPLVNWAKPMDFKFWYDRSKEYAAPFLNAVFRSPGWDAILTSGNSNWVGDEGKTFAAAELKYGKGYFRICQIQLSNRLKANPVAEKFISMMIK